MRNILSAALLILALSANSGSAAEFTAAEVQALVTASQTASVEKPASVTLVVGGVPVAFTVTRDAVGNVIARPVPDPGSKGVVISQVSIAVTVSDNGLVVPSSVTLVMSDQSISSYNVRLNADGTVANVTPAGTFAPGNSGLVKAGSGALGDGAAEHHNYGGNTAFADGGADSAGYAAPPPGATSTNVVSPSN